MNGDQDFFRAHNRVQKQYFEGTFKKTMVPTGTPYVRRQIRELLVFAQIRPGETLLEVGCGMGRYTVELARSGYRVEGLDLSQVLLDRLSRYAGELRIPLHCADLIQSPASLRGRFDAVIGFFTLHHLHDPGASFQAMRKLIKPGGRIAFLEPNPFNPLYYLQISLSPGMRWEGEKGLLNMRSSLLFPALSAAGFSDLRVKQFGFFPPQLANRRPGRELEPLLERLLGWTGLLPFQLFGASIPK